MVYLSETYAVTFVERTITHARCSGATRVMHAAVAVTAAASAVSHDASSRKLLPQHRKAQQCEPLRHLACRALGGNDRYRQASLSEHKHVDPGLTTAVHIEKVMVLRYSTVRKLSLIHI